MSSSWPTLESAAESAIAVETDQQRPQRRWFANFSDPVRNPFLNWCPPPSTLRAYLLKDAVIDGEHMLLLKGNLPVRDTGYLLSDERMSQIVCKDVEVPEPSRTTIICCNIAYGNYFHWTTQTLPAIYSILKDQDASLFQLALPELTEWQEQSLQLLGYGSVARLRIDRNKKYRMHRAVYSEFLNGGGSFRYFAVERETFNRISSGVGKTKAGPTRIYVARTDTERRKMRGEPAVINDLRSRGFYIFEAGSLPLPDQIRVFAGAEIVVGLHGAGLSNIVFCRPGALVYELLPSHYTNACFCNVAYNCDLDYWADAFASEGFGIPALRDWDIDIDFFRYRMTEIEFAAARRRLGKPDR